jgi:nucleotide-binding universal stress UspA family protein
MPWKPIIAGVNESVEGAWAATVAWNIAKAAETDCYLIHASDQAADIPVWAQTLVDIESLEADLTALTRRRVEEYLTGNVPFESLEQLDVRLGKPKWVLARAAQEKDAGLVVLGGKQSSGRRFGGSTAFHVVQSVNVPTLIVVPSKKDPERVLAAVDLSHAAGPTIAAAQRIAGFLGAELKVIHVAEPMPDIPSYTTDLPEEQNVKRATEEFEQIVGPLIGGGDILTEVISGSAEATIAKQAEEWGADIVAIGSHGKGWVERILLGSTTHKLIRNMPASLLVVPVPEP